MFLVSFFFPPGFHGSHLFSESRLLTLDRRTTGFGTLHRRTTGFPRKIQSIFRRPPIALPVKSLCHFIRCHSRQCVQFCQMTVRTECFYKPFSDQDLCHWQIRYYRKVSGSSTAGHNPRDDVQKKLQKSFEEKSAPHRDQAREEVRDLIELSVS